MARVAVATAALAAGNLAEKLMALALEPAILSQPDYLMVST